jgi:predicted amino acid dehydrogenase
VTTGHEVTAAAVVMAVRNVVSAAGRSLDAERLGLVGVGSVGTAALRLMLKVLPHPAEIILCDVFAQADQTEAFKRQLESELSFSGRIEVVTAQRGAAPAAFYEATLMLGAASATRVLDVSSMRPGTLIVDDSSPHCFDPVTAIRRLEHGADILFTEAGLLGLPSPFTEERYLPLGPSPFARMHRFVCSPSDIMGCVFSGLICLASGGTEPTAGPEVQSNA